MQTHVLEDRRLAEHVATHIAAELRLAVGARGTATFAASGGSTPGPMLAILAELDVPWSRIHLLQVDERVAPARDPARNLTRLEETLIRRVSLPPDHVHPMPVDVDGLDPESAASGYGRLLQAVAGTPAVLDVVQLGLGADGHVASLVPDDPVLEVADRDVAATHRPYRGHRRVTLTLPVLNRARRLVWMATGAEKSEAVSRLLAGDPSIPAGRVRPERAELFLDAAAAPGS